MRNIQERKTKCRYFYDELTKELSEFYDSIGSCNHDESIYLIPKGTEEQITYYGKPDRSFRYSDHWNWYSSIRKCEDPSVIQCYNADIPEPRSRIEDWKASKPRFAIQVGYCDKNNEYHAIYGEAYDKETKEWYWLDNNPKDIAKKLLSREL